MNHIFTFFYDGYPIYACLLNKWKQKKESCRGWLFLGRLYSSPPLHCLHGVICGEIEMRLAGRAETYSWFTHIVKSHRQRAAWRCPPANLRHTDLSSRRSPSSSRTFMAAITQPLCNESQSACCWTCWMLWKKMPVNDLQSNNGCSVRDVDKWERMVQKEVRMVHCFFVGMYKYPRLKAQRISAVPEEHFISKQ